MKKLLYISSIAVLLAAGCRKEKEKRPPLPNGIPISFIASVENLSNVFLSWKVHRKNIQPHSFKIERNGVVIDTVEGNVLGYFDANLEPGKYVYELFAICSDTVISVKANIEIPVIEYNTPSNFTYEIINNNVVLTWDALTDGMRPSFYRIVCNELVLCDLPSHKYRYYNANLDTGVYLYSLFACYSNGVKIGIGDTEVIISKKLQKIYISGDNRFTYTTEKNTVKLSWKIPNDLPDSFQIERNGEIIKVLDNNTFTYSDADLECGNYRYNLLLPYTEESILVVIGVLQCKIDCKEWK